MDRWKAKSLAYFDSIPEQGVYIENYAKYKGHGDKHPPDYGKYVNQKYEGMDVVYHPGERGDTNSHSEVCYNSSISPIIMKEDSNFPFDEILEDMLANGESDENGETDPNSYCRIHNKSYQDIHWCITKKIKSCSYFDDCDTNLDAVLCLESNNKSFLCGNDDFLSLPHNVWNSLDSIDQKLWALLSQKGKSTIIQGLTKSVLCGNNKVNYDCSNGEKNNSVAGYFKYKEDENVHEFHPHVEVEPPVVVHTDHIMGITFITLHRHEKVSK